MILAPVLADPARPALRPPFASPDAAAARSCLSSTLANLKTEKAWPAAAKIAAQPRLVGERDSVAKSAKKPIDQAPNFTIAKTLRRQAAALLKGHFPRAHDERAASTDDAGKWYPVCACSTTPHAAATAITAIQRTSGSVSFAGLMRCGSVWTCAECAQKIETVRGDEVKRLIETARSNGYVVVMITHTFPHTIAETARESMDGLSAALRKTRQSGSYQRFRQSVGYVGLARSTEITHGVHGWHPHVHELWCLDPRQSAIGIEKLDQKALETAIFEGVFPSWRSAAKCVFGKEPSEKHGLDVSLVWSASDYIAKVPDRAAALAEAGKTRWGADAEMTKSIGKRGKKASRTIWDIIPIAAGQGRTSDEQKAAGLPVLTPASAKALLLDYASGTWRKRRMYWTPTRTKNGKKILGLRDLFGLGEDLTDEQIADGELPMSESQAKENREETDPVAVAIELDLLSLAGLGREYLDQLQQRLAPRRDPDNPKAPPQYQPLVEFLQSDGWVLLLSQFPDDEESQLRYTATHPHALRCRQKGVAVHDLLMVGPPGAGKSLMASCLPGILPPLDPAEALEVSMVQSVAGTLAGGRLTRTRPFRSPHHSASMAALTGGGLKVKPGEVSMAHLGVLFLDELPEFQRAVLDSLRQPLETGNVSVARANAHVTFPARVQLIAAMNPCRCGHLGDASLACARAPRCAADYQAKVSGPLLDRIDLHVEVNAVSAADLVLPPPAEGSAEVAARVAAARTVQAARYADHPVRTNAEADGDLLEAVATPDEPGRQLLAQAAAAMRMSARGYSRVLRVARTIADLAGSEGVGRIHVAEALSYRRQAPRA